MQRGTGAGHPWSGAEKRKTLEAAQSEEVGRWGQRVEEPGARSHRKEFGFDSKGNGKLF